MNFEEKKAWELYCKETGGMIVRNFWWELPEIIQNIYLEKISNVVMKRYVFMRYLPKDHGSWAMGRVAHKANSKKEIPEYLQNIYGSHLIYIILREEALKTIDDLKVLLNETVTDLMLLDSKKVLSTKEKSQKMALQRTYNELFFEINNEDSKVTT